MSGLSTRHGFVVIITVIAIKTIVFHRFIIAAFDPKVSQGGLRFWEQMGHMDRSG